jgi:membrane associated rhomboid family serine protease
MRRSAPRYAASSFSFGPGPLSSAMKALIGANVAMFFIQALADRELPGGLSELLGLVPFHVVRNLWVWQVATYMFLHGGVIHILFNMLALWMFGTELERIWGTRDFLKFYFVTGIGAAILTVLFSLLPASISGDLYRIPVIGASGAIYGLLLAYGLYFPDRPIYMYLLFPIPAKYFVIIMGAIAFYASFSNAGGGVANATHLGGLLVAYLYLKGGQLRLSPFAEVKYRYVKWRMNKLRRKFDVYPGGRERIH